MGNRPVFPITATTAATNPLACAFTSSSLMPRRADSFQIMDVDSQLPRQPPHMAEPQGQGRDVQCQPSSHMRRQRKTVGFVGLGLIRGYAFLRFSPLRQSLPGTTCARHVVRRRSLRIRAWLATWRTLPLPE